MMKLGIALKGSAMLWECYHDWSNCLLGLMGQRLANFKMMHFPMLSAKCSSMRYSSWCLKLNWLTWIKIVKALLPLVIVLAGLIWLHVWQSLYLQVPHVAKGSKLGLSYACFFVGHQKYLISTSCDCKLPTVIKSHMDDIIRATSQPLAANKSW